MGVMIQMIAEMQAVIGRIQPASASVHPSLVGTSLAPTAKSQRSAGVVVLGTFIVLVILVGVAWYIMEPMLNQGGKKPPSSDASVAVQAKPVTPKPDESDSDASAVSAESQPDPVVVKEPHGNPTRSRDGISSVKQQIQEHLL